jgi:hypothetical protein
LRRRPAQEKGDWQDAVSTSQENAADYEEVRAMSEVAWKTTADVMEERGEAKGELRARRDDLRALLEERFGPLPETVVQRIDAATDADRLRLAIRKVLRIESLDDLSI